ncbi:hypothetical protein CRE_25441 [Caenorhabditis remanei]|uniref:F-box domain-containing protein n=1 Tax=Caenorhabditis remanei TaxID=31234 RepID=E3LT70_CAERE|nr:hypothetical protein CRE_25441 [Caenorhabditis remanei]
MLNTIFSLFQKRPSNNTPMIMDAENISNECFEQIFHRLDKQSLVNCILTCHRFEQLISSCAFWVEHARVQGIPDVLPSLDWRRASNNKKFGGNGNNEIDVSTFNFDMKRIVLSGRGYSPITPLFVSHFEAARDHTIRGVLRSDDFSIRGPADGIKMEIDGGHGCKSHPDVSNCFAFSFTAGTISIFIDLIHSGIDAWVLDHVRPKIRISQKVNHRHDCSARLSFAAQLNYNETQWIQEIGMRQTTENINQKRFKSIHRTWEQWTEKNWEDFVIEFDDYPSGMRHLTVLNEGQDGMFWAGFFGPKIANIQVQVIMPETPVVRSFEVDTERCREDDNPNVEEEPGRFGVPLFIRHRRMWAVPPAVARQAEDNDDEEDD